MNHSYTYCIIGGGPAGLMAARTLLSLGETSLCLIEKSTDYTRSIVCGEGVWKTPFDRLLPHNEQWIKFPITTADFRSPDGTSVFLHREGEVMGYIIDRPKMQEDLLQEIAQQATVYRGCKVTKVTPSNGSHTVFSSDGTLVTVQVVIDASGPASKLGACYGLPSLPLELEPASYALVAGVQQDENAVILQMSSRFGPGGYFWSFPHAPSVANVGMVVGKGWTKDMHIRQRVEEAIRELYPTGKIISWHGGAIPNYKSPRALTAPGYLRCGDSAELVNSISRSGISESMQSGVLVAEYALLMAACSTEKVQQEIGLAYEKQLYQQYGKAQYKVAKMKKSLYTAISDKQFNAAARALNKKPVEQRTMWDILRVTCWRTPRLLLALRHLL